MIEIKNGRGLCMTCNNEPTCFNRARRGPALYCETFDDYVPPAVRARDRMPSADASMALPAAEEDASTYTGLCMNCRHRRTCKHPGREGGIWHCEDYE